MFEGGVRVPFIVRWPGHVLANRVDETSVMSGADWLPTLCALIGVKTKETDFDGVNVSEAWLGRSLAERTKPLFWKTSAPGSDAAMREGPWKLIVPTRRRGPVELYHIPSDPGEAKNVAKENPAVVKKLSAQVQAWVATLPKSYVKTDDPEK
jgi:N-acetylgalactosamine-6-sulfatase